MAVVWWKSWSGRRRLLPLPGSTGGRSEVMSGTASGWSSISSSRMAHPVIKDVGNSSSSSRAALRKVELPELRIIPWIHHFTGWWSSALSSFSSSITSALWRMTIAFCSHRYRHQCLRHPGDLLVSFFLSLGFCKFYLLLLLMCIPGVIVCSLIQRFTQAYRRLSIGLLRCVQVLFLAFWHFQPPAITLGSPNICFDTFSSIKQSCTLGVDVTILSDGRLPRTPPPPGGPTDRPAETYKFKRQWYRLIRSDVWQTNRCRSVDWQMLSAVDLSIDSYIKLFYTNHPICVCPDHARSLLCFRRGTETGRGRVIVCKTCWCFSVIMWTPALFSSLNISITADKCESCSLLANLISSILSIFSKLVSVKFYML